MLYTVFCRLVDMGRVTPKCDPREARNAFNQLSIPKIKINKNHSHTESAQCRNSATKFCRTLAQNLGLSPWSYQMSPNDQYVGVSGYRDWRWDKDVRTSLRNDSSEDKHAYLIDVDFHIDMERFLTGRNTPTTIYTTQPSKVAQSSGDTVHYFDNDNYLNARVADGAVYRHKLWNYTSDNLRVSSKFLGITYATTMYLVDRRNVDVNKQLVMFTPLGSWFGPLAWLANWWIAGTQLSYLEPVKNGWASLFVQDKNGLSVSVGRAGSYGETTVEVATLERMFASDRLSKQAANVGSIASWAEADRNIGVILADYIRDNKEIHAPYVASVDEHVISYTANVNTDGDDKPTITSFMSPVVSGGSYAPVDDKKTCMWGVESRITNLTQVRELDISGFAKKCADEFVTRFVGKMKLSPVEFDDVWENQTRKVQRTILEEAANLGCVDDDSIKSFMKRESYGKLGTPRIISTLPGLTKLEYSRYTLAVGKYIKSFSWYAFKTPLEISARVAEIMTGQTRAAETDFSRMDGHISQEVRELIEQPIMSALFSGDDYVLELMSEQYGKKGNVKGVNYDTGFARASGSPETSLFNTLLTAYISYYAMRKLRMSPDDAWDALGVYGGDDGLVAVPKNVTPDKIKSVYSKVAIEWGQVLKVDVKERGEPVSFLARFYGHAWSGGEDSMCDIRRQIVKFHNTVNMPESLPEEGKAREKARALLLTDGNTPIVSDMCRKIMSETVGHDLDDISRRAIVNHWAKFSAEDQYPNEYGAWMEDIIAKDLDGFNFETFNEWLESGDALKPPVCLDVQPEQFKSEMDVIVNGDIVKGTGLKPSVSKQTRDEIPATRSNKRAGRGGPKRNLTHGGQNTSKTKSFKEKKTNTKTNQKK